eukprot:gb/GECG01001470.1/.p1 GENE.gb/GECG01001470.1/~~gb/GECG01001470.1/.p1  ORF type:complete len:164 (+),score=15.85 gb/GECG01001470.1/:1-492(+)
MATVSREPSKRVRKACVPCAKSKQKCDEFRPCKRCQVKGTPSRCVDQPSRSEKRRREIQDHIDDQCKEAKTLLDNSRSDISLVDWVLASTQPRSETINQEPTPTETTATVTNWLASTDGLNASTNVAWEPSQLMATTMEDTFSNSALHLCGITTEVNLPHSHK